jgi:hypothetical protein
MSNFIIEENKYNTLTWKCDNILKKYEGDEEIVYVPDGVNVINGAFQNNLNVKKIVLPNSVTAIDCHSFQGCTNLEEIIFSESITIIRPYAFTECNSLKSLNFPDSLKKLESSIFKLPKLESVRFPKEFTTNDVSYCPKLKKIEFSENANDVSITNCDSLDELILADNVELLALSDCNNIKKITWSKKLSGISINGCNGLNEILLPESVSRFNIRNCTSLEKIYIPGSVRYLGADIFNGVNDGLNITFGGSFDEWKNLIKDRTTYEGNGPTQNQYHYLGELSWVIYAPTEKTESVIHAGFKYNLKCEK